MRNNGYRSQETAWKKETEQTEERNIRAVQAEDLKDRDPARIVQEIMRRIDGVVDARDAPDEHG